MNDDRRRRLHPAEDVVLPAAPPVPPPPKSERKSLLPQAAKSPTAVAIIAVITALGGNAGLTKILHGESASSAEIQEMRADMKALTEQFAEWRKERDSEKVHEQVQDKQIELLASGYAIQNGGPPNRSWPEASERDWFAPNNPPPLHRTDRQWPVFEEK